MYPELLWAFAQLPDEFVVLDTETTGLPDSEGLPSIITIGIARVSGQKVVESVEFKVRPERKIQAGAMKVHGINQDLADSFPPLSDSWAAIQKWLDHQVIVIHNASFDWPLMMDHAERDGLLGIKSAGVLCSQKSSAPWAQMVGMKCSSRGPSLDRLSVSGGEVIA